MARLTEQDWLDHGLKTLAIQGVGALKAAKMAEKLGVSRGSFYWHFDDMRAFETRLLDRWQELTTDETIRDMDSKQRESERLPGLMIRALMGRPDIDRAIRVWAEIDARARAKLRKVDALRIGYLRDLLVASGVGENQAVHRARFIYAASLGDAAIAPEASPHLTAAQIREIAELVSRPRS